ncbi:MAG: ribbon-helix-helix domain-containing protein [Candidatus Heimdallarchaeaceae archaeon]
MKRTSVLLNDEDYQYLTELAKKLGIKRSQIIRRVISIFVQKHKNKEFDLGI